MYVAASERRLGVLEGRCVSEARLAAVDLSKLDLRSYAGAEHADAAWVRPTPTFSGLGPHNVAKVLIWFWPPPPVGARPCRGGRERGPSYGCTSAYD